MLACQLQVPKQFYLVLAKWAVVQNPGTSNKTILYAKNRICFLSLAAFADANCAGCKYKGRSATGTLVEVNNTLVL